MFSPEGYYILIKHYEQGWCLVPQSRQGSGIKRTKLYKNSTKIEQFRKKTLCFICTTFMIFAVSLT